MLKYGRPAFTLYRPARNPEHREICCNGELDVGTAAKMVRQPVQNLLRWRPLGALSQGLAADPLAFAERRRTR